MGRFREAGEKNGRRVRRGDFNHKPIDLATHKWKPIELLCSDLIHHRFVQQFHARFQSLQLRLSFLKNRLRSSDLFRQLVDNLRVCQKPKYLCSSSSAPTESAESSSSSTAEEEFGRLGSKKKNDRGRFEEFGFSFPTADRTGKARQRKSLGSKKKGENRGRGVEFT